MSVRNEFQTHLPNSCPFTKTAFNQFVASIEQIKKHQDELEFKSKKIKENSSWGIIYCWKKHLSYTRSLEDN